MRIVSLVPSATEILFALGVGTDVVGRSHECDHPPEAADLPAVTSDVVTAALPGTAIEAAAAGAVRDVHSIYRLDPKALAALSPDLVVTQRVCGVCAVPAADVREAVPAMPAKVLGTDPQRLEDVWGTILTIAEAAGADLAGAALVGSIRRRLGLAAAATTGLQRPRVAVIAWPEPLFAPGPWVPDMVRAAGGSSVLGLRGGTAGGVDFGELAAARPDVVVLALAGLRMQETQLLVRKLATDPRWSEVAMKARIVAVDALGCFGRPGPRLADGIELLAWVLHRPDLALKPPPGRGAELIEAGWIDVSSLPARTRHVVR